MRRVSPYWAFIPLWSALCLVAESSAQSRGSSPMTGDQIETALEHQLCDSIGDTCVKTQAVVGEITLAPAGGEVKFVGDSSDTTAKLVAISGQTEPQIAIEAFDGDQLTLEHNGTRGRIANSAGVLEIRSNDNHQLLLGGILKLSTWGNGVYIPNAGCATAPLVFNGDWDTGLCWSGVDQVSLGAGGTALVTAVNTTTDYVDLLGCRFYGSLATAPTPNGDCDWYYDTTSTGADCVRINGAWVVRAGSGTCS